MSERLLIVGHVGSTLAMVGVIWMVQLVVYPQFKSLPNVDTGDYSFANYVQDHSVRMIMVLAIFAPLELVFSLLLWVQRPFNTSASLTFVAGFLLALCWVSTAIWFAPLHGRLQQAGHDSTLINQLLTTNWIRTILWTTRGALALYITASVIERSN